MQAQGINDSGQIVGFYANNGIANGLFLSGGTYTTIDPPGSIYTWLYGINDTGKIVGGYVKSGIDHGYLLSGGCLHYVRCRGSDGHQS